MKRVLFLIPLTLLLFSSKFASSQIVTWGNKFYGGEPSFSGEYTSAATGDLSTGVTSITSNRYAVAVLKQDGSVVTFGGTNYGGSTTTTNSDTNPATGDLSSGVVSIASNETAFAALKSDGSVVTWGLKVHGGDHTFSSGTSQQSTQAANGSLSSGVTKIVSSTEAFAALKSDGSVVTWGKIISGGNYNLTASGVSAANGDLSSGVAEIYGRGYNFVALKTNGSVVTWGWTQSGGSSTVTQGNNLAANGVLTSGVEKIYYNSEAFVAKKSDGGLVSWGSNYHGGNYDYSIQNVDAVQCVSPSCTGDLTSGVDTVFPLQGGFLATKTDGSVFFWGESSSNPNSVPNSSYSAANGTLTNIIDVIDHNYSYAALKSDGSVVTWGQKSAGGDFDFSDENTAAKSGDLSSGVVAIYKSSYYDYDDMMMGSNGKSFAALKSDGSVVTWGAKIAGGSLSYTDSKTVAASGDLSSGVVGIYTPNNDNGGAYIALKNDGSIVSWGNAKNGGNPNFSDSSTSSVDLSTYVITDIHVTFYAAYLATYNDDTTAPTIALIGDSQITVEVGGTYSDAGATAADDIDGTLTNSITTTNNVDTSVVGTYTITYSVTDSAGNSAQVTRQVNVVAKTIPVITLVGNPTILVEKGSVYTDQGATAQDSYDGTLTNSIVATSSVDTNTAAAYTIRYNVSDPSGNDAIEVVRTVIVVEVPFKNNNTSLTGVESKNNLATGNYATAMGWYATATGEISTAIGHRTTASDFASLVIGQYNSAGSTATNATTYSASNTAFVIGNGTSDSSKSDALIIKFNGDATFAGDLNVNSDARLKANIISLGSTLAKLLQIDGKTYTMKKDVNETQKIGLLAQDIEEVFPELVSENNGIKSVNYQGLVPVLINALKDQQSEIDELKSMVYELIQNNNK